MTAQFGFSTKTLSYVYSTFFCQWDYGIYISLISIENIRRYNKSLPEIEFICEKEYKQKQ